MAMTAPFRNLPLLAAGLLLGVAGWVGGGLAMAPPAEFEPQLVVRPASLQLVSQSGPAPIADNSLPGRFVLDKAGVAVELKAAGWPSSHYRIEELRGMTTVRARAPKASLAMAVKGDKKAAVKLLELPAKNKLASAKGRAELEPGHHELLVQADGYLPKRLSLTVKPGERREMTVQLQPVPGLPAGLSGLGGGALPSLPGRPPGAGARPRAAAGGYPSARPPSAPAYRPPASPPPRYQPRPRYLPPPRQSPPRPRPPAPVPRFTPIAPVAKPAAPHPVPMFTPIHD
jgi:hypothetical protein